MASRLTDETSRPCIIFTTSQGILKGSGRSVDGVDLMELLSGFKEKCITLGGHKQACGLTLEIANYDELVTYITTHYQKPQEEPSKPYIVVGYDDLTKENLEELWSFKPFGQGRKLPLMMIKIDKTTNYRSLKNPHQLKWSYPMKGYYLSVVSFANNEGYEYYFDNDVYVIGKLQKNTFNGQQNYDIKAEHLSLEKPLC